MRGVQTGRDMGYITDELQKRYGIRAVGRRFIARDQTEKATAAFNRARQLEVGIEQAVWVHSRWPGSIRAPAIRRRGAKRLCLASKMGWLDPEVGYKIQPGELINCRCVSRSILPGFS